MTGSKEETAAAEIEVIVFRVGGQTYGADAHQVSYISPASSEAFALPGLGVVSAGGRALHFRGAGGERAQLRVDRVEGVRTIPATNLRQMPPAAGAPPYAIGVWLEDDRAVLLIDLPKAFIFHLKN